jgi:dipeptidyl aminopeptidase/acylaminoacyl peptidase
MPARQRFISPEDLYRLQLVRDCQISPDGRHAIFCVQRVDAQTQKEYANLCLVSTAGGQPRQFTYGDQVDKYPVWSPDGRSIAFLSNRGQANQPQIHLIAVDGGEARPLTDLKGKFGRLVWSPDGKYLVCAFRKKDKETLEREADSYKRDLGVVARHITRLVYKADGYGFLPQERWHVWRIETRTGRAKQLTSGDHDHLEPGWSPDGRQIVFRSNRAADPDRDWDQDDLWLISAEGGELGRLQTELGPKKSPRFSPDGRWVAYYQDGGRSQRWRNSSLWLTPTNGDGPARNLTAPFDLHIAHETINDVGQMRTTPPLWSPDSRQLSVQVTQQGRTVLKMVDINGAAPTDLISGPGCVEEFHLDQSGSKSLYLYGTLTDPGQVWVSDRVTDQARPLTRFNQKLLKNITLGAVEEVWFSGAAGDKLQGWIITPPDFDEGQTYPSILQIHGGPMVQYGQLFMHEFYYLAAQGYVVYFCNPRGGRGYGEAHTRAITNDWGGPDYADLMAWVDVVQQKPYLDPTRMGLTGGSYGGFMTLWLIAHTDRFLVAVAQRSVSNLVSMDGSSDLSYRFDALFGAEQPFWEDVEAYWRQSPLKYIAQVKTPTLIIHSEQDFRTDIEQGEQVFAALKKLGVPTEMVRFPDESHGLSREGRTDRRVARLKHIVRWFDRYLK